MKAICGICKHPSGSLSEYQEHMLKVHKERVSAEHLKGVALKNMDLRLVE